MTSTLKFLTKVYMSYCSEQKFLLHCRLEPVTVDGEVPSQARYH